MTGKWTVALLAAAAVGRSALAPRGSANTPNDAPADQLTSVREARADGGESGLADVAGVAVGTDGRFVVGDGGNAQLALFDSTGKLLRRVGRRGGLEGEYVRLQWLGHCAGSIVAHDIALSRVSTFDDSLHIRSARSVPKAFDSREMAGCTADGRPIILNDSNARVVPGVQRLPLAIVALDVRRTHADTLHRFLGRTFNYVKSLGTGIDVPLGARTLVSATAGRILVVESEGDSLWTLEGTRWRSVHLNGLPAARRPIAIDSRRARQLLTWTPRTEQERLFVPSLLSQTADAATVPRIDALVGADDGTAWVGLVPAADGSRLWIAYDAQGKRLRSVSFTWTFAPRVVRADRWWGVERDTIGVESVVRYRVEPARGSAPQR